MSLLKAIYRKRLSVYICLNWNHLVCIHLFLVHVEPNRPYIYIDQSVKLRQDDSLTGIEMGKCQSLFYFSHSGRDESSEHSKELRFVKFLAITNYVF